ncbi:unnamed protein product [Thelazia callipaeda]|uniref:protein-tyrosine-phosphatase n=1 Tax=Thelazia callipaeda TaxID=103827 RepID=A0A0N5D8B3_THECL|nr:unnamed protein product [Thelazia callipaeda]
MKNDESGSDQIADFQNNSQKTTLSVLMEQKQETLKMVGNQQCMNKRIFKDITNCRKKALREETRKKTKNPSNQTTITDFALVKQKTYIHDSYQITSSEKNGENSKKLNLFDRSDSDNSISDDNSNRYTFRSKFQSDMNKSLDNFKLLMNKKMDEFMKNSNNSDYSDLDNSSYFTSSRSQSPMDIDHNYENNHTKWKQNSYCESLSYIDKEICQLHNSFNQILGKRFSTTTSDDCNDGQASNAKRKKKYSLPIITKPSILTAGFACIEKLVLKNLIESMDLCEFAKKYILVDCRYPYEYKGGHIKGALNIHNPVILEATFFDHIDTKKLSYKQEIIPIFYCEYSTVRGPMLASYLRKSDRVRNFRNYPFLFYDEIYVLEGGYNSFFNTDDLGYKNLCEPMGYITMRDDKYANEMKAFRNRKFRSGIGFETGMFETAMIRKNSKFRSAPPIHTDSESPSTSYFVSPNSSCKFSPKNTISAILLNLSTTNEQRNSI